MPESLPKLTGRELNRMAAICGIKRQRVFWIFKEGDTALRRRIEAYLSMRPVGAYQNLGTPLKLATWDEIIAELSSRRVPYILSYCDKWPRNKRSFIISRNFHNNVPVWSVFQDLADQCKEEKNHA